MSEPTDRDRELAREWADRDKVSESGSRWEAVRVAFLAGLAAGREAERDACAKLAESMTVHASNPSVLHTAERIAAAIRNRSQP